MSLETPTTTEISDNIVSQMEANLNQSVPLLSKSFIRVMAKAMAGVFVLIYKYGGFIFLQVFPSTASNKETIVNGKTITPLAEWGSLIGVGSQTPAVQAELYAAVTVQSAGATLPAGSQLINRTNGVTYLTTTSVLLSGSSVTLGIKASADQSGGDGSGTIGNLDAGAIVSFANPLPSVARDATIQSVITYGVDAETTDSYRQRIIERFQARPQGGAYADYRVWGEAVEGIAAVYPYTGQTPGAVNVYVLASDGPGIVNGIPTAAQLQAVLDACYYDEEGRATRAPVNSLVNTYSIYRIEFEAVITDLSVDNIDQVKADIDAALVEYYYSREPYIAGLSALPQRNRVTRSGVAGVVDDVVSAAGGIFSDAKLTRSGVFVDVYTLGIGQLARSGGVIYQ